ncbi:PepSY-associated TM helix domain-containing protein [Dyella caseinilytica]|uniref:PepSY domain-containing protein n=1 Tax=Dyella caseinilytica TaxID=1849581 RepID=A0ABX7GRH4_9GAMM|nr:PepSY-associated TM helix domain-containing protein [Dyella caseinilytica]QRN52524.1 PepSY domain-containing protein [Dyella caseinilytica]GGA06758.1 membrane protein [Dyella caseinilytica]
MIAAHKLKRWYLIHKWTSLICTAFLLLICLTGLPLVFREEINHWLEPHHYVALPADTPTANIDRMVAAARAMYPGQSVASVFIDDDEPQVMVWMVPSFEVMRADPDAIHFIRFDARTAQVLETSLPESEQPNDFIDIMLALHKDLFLDLPGELFLGLMALLFVIAIVSGVVLYGPFMKKLPFGTVRHERSARVKWLDLHNMLGIVVMAWTFVVGATGVMNELSTPLFGLWQRTDVKALLASYHGRSMPEQGDLPSVQAALETARHAVPGMNIISIAYPGNPFGSPYHYLFWSKGDTSLTSRLLTPVLVDASTGQLSAVIRMPWYLRLLEVSRPLHFGDYGGMPLKILWALLDVITIVILGSGLYLWLARRKHQSERLARIVAAHQRQPWVEPVHEP